MSHFSHKVKCICTQPQRANNLENYFSLQSQQNVSTSSVQLEIEIFHPVFLAEQFKLSPSLMENIRIRIFKYWFLILGSTMFYIETKCSGRCEVLVFYHKAFCFYNRQQRKSHFSLILTNLFPHVLLATLYMSYRFLSNTDFLPLFYQDQFCGMHINKQLFHDRFLSCSWQLLYLCD